MRVYVCGGELLLRQVRQAELKVKMKMIFRIDANHVFSQINFMEE